MSDLHVQQSISGFIASAPSLTKTRKNESRFFAKIGQEHYRPEPNGGFTKLPTTFHNLVMYRKAAELAAEQFQKRDWFVAEGYVKQYTDADGLPQEEFVAKKLGHDSARTQYDVIRKEPTSAQKATTIAEVLKAQQQPTEQMIGTTDPAPEPSTATRPTVTGSPAPAQAGAAVGL